MVFVAAVGLTGFEHPDISSQDFSLFGFSGAYVKKLIHAFLVRIQLRSLETTCILEKQYQSMLWCGFLNKSNLYLHSFI